MLDKPLTPALSPQAGRGGTKKSAPERGEGEIKKLLPSGGGNNKKIRSRAGKGGNKRQVAVVSEIASSSNSSKRTISFSFK